MPENSHEGESHATIVGPILCHLVFVPLLGGGTKELRVMTKTGILLWFLKKRTKADSTSLSLECSMN